MIKLRFEDYIASLRKSSAQAIAEYVRAGEHALPKEYVQQYTTLYKALTKLLVAHRLTDDKESIALWETLRAKKIPITLWAKYTALAAFILPLIASRKTQNAQQTQALETLIKNIIQISTTLSSQPDQVKEQFVFVQEGILGRTFGRVKSVIVSAAKSVLSGVALFASTLIQVYNNVFSFLMSPVRKVVNAVPGGDLMLKAALTPFLSLNLTPTVLAVLKVHNLITHPTVAKTAPMVRKMVTGSIWKELDSMLENLSKEIEIDDLDKLLAEEEKPEENK